MAKFVYKAKDSKGESVKGLIEASDQKQALSVLKEKELYCYYLAGKSEGLFPGLTKKFRKVNFSDITAFTRQLATMVNAGLPLTESLAVLSDQDSTMSEIAGQILRDVKEGRGLSESLKRFPDVFSQVYVALVSAGEAAGILDNILNRLADNMESQREFKGKVKNAMIYPVIVLILMVAVIFGMMVLVIPKLTSLYEEFDAELPQMTKILIGMSNFSSRFWWLILILVGGFVFLSKILLKNLVVRRKVDEYKFKLPIFGKLSKMVAMTEFSRTLGLLVGAGVSLVEGLKIASKTGNNILVEEAILFSSDQVEKGLRLSTVISQIDFFPSIVYQMIAVGEETGKMDEVLSKVSNFFQTESEQAIKGLTTALEPLIMIVLGVGVLFLILAILMPIYNLTSSIK
jgi:type IV pilus assembly protein PilC